MTPFSLSPSLSRVFVARWMKVCCFTDHFSWFCVAFHHVHIITQCCIGEGHKGRLKQMHLYNIAVLRGHAWSRDMTDCLNEDRRAHFQTLMVLHSFIHMKKYMCGILRKRAWSSDSDCWIVCQNCRTQPPVRRVCRRHFLTRTLLKHTDWFISALLWPLDLFTNEWLTCWIFFVSKKDFTPTRSGGEESGSNFKKS